MKHKPITYLNLRADEFVADYGDTLSRQRKHADILRRVRNLRRVINDPGFELDKQEVQELVEEFHWVNGIMSHMEMGLFDILRLTNDPDEGRHLGCRVGTNKSRDETVLGHMHSIKAILKLINHSSSKWV